MPPRTGDTDDRSLRRRAVLQAGGVAASLGVTGTVGLGMAGADEATTHTFLCQNAWLLDEAGDVDNDHVQVVAKPALEQRARGFGARLSYSDLDIVGFQEVFDGEQREQIRRPVQPPVDDAVGPRERPENVAVSSGLYTLTRGNHPIEITERVAFDNRGNRRRDADAYSEKGVLFTRIGLPHGSVDLFTTHLLAGGGWPGEAVDPSPVREPLSPAEYRRRQLGEFEDFVRAVKTEHDPEREVPIICAGDFNIASGDPADPALQDFRRTLGLLDAWEETHPDAPGQTDSTAITDACVFDPMESPPSYCDGGVDSEAERIDYIFVEDHDAIAIEDISRRVFWRELAPPDQFFADEDEEIPNYLTDHVGLELEFSVSARRYGSAQ